MFVNAIIKLPHNYGILKTICPAITAARHGHRLRGKPFGVAKTIEKRLQYEADKEKQFEVETKPVDIGFPAMRLSRSEETKMKIEYRSKLKNNPQLEKLSRNLQLKVDDDRVKADWLESDGQFQIKSIADHYGIYKHLFDFAYFIPRITLDIKYAVSDDEYAPVYYGNTLKPTHAQNQPEVSFDAKKKLLKDQPDGDTLWTLVLTNPDGHFTENDKEYVHWFVNDLKQRTFKTYDFYRKHQDNITPAGLAFFQSDYDTNLTEFYHNVLEMQEPIFEYAFPQPYHPPEEYFPLRQAINLYLDRYRDPKQINKEFLVRELKKTDPFDGPKPPKRFPGAHPLKDIPSWLITEKKKTRLGAGRINEIKEEYR